MLLVLLEWPPKQCKSTRICKLTSTVNLMRSGGRCPCEGSPQNRKGLIFDFALVSEHIAPFVDRSLHIASRFCGLLVKHLILKETLMWTVLRWRSWPSQEEYFTCDEEEEEDSHGHVTETYRCGHSQRVTFVFISL